MLINFYILLLFNLITLKTILISMINLQIIKIDH